MVIKKVCILGGYAVGKSSLMARCATTLFPDTYQTTIGVNISKKDLNVDGYRVNLRLWELAGDADSLQARTAYLRGAAGYLLVVDGTRPETLDKAMELKELVESELGEIPFILLL